MKIFIPILSVALLAGCAVPQEIRNSQKVEFSSLGEYHRAQKEQYRAGVVVKAAKVALASAVALQVKADSEFEAAKKNLEASLAQ